MWITTSKHANQDIKKSAQKLAQALPDAEFVRRGEQGLDRIEELARREAQHTLVVMSKDGNGTSPHNSDLVLRSRGRGGESDAKWHWDATEMVVGEICFGSKRAGEWIEGQPYRIDTDSDEARKAASFLGLVDHPLASYYDDPPAVWVRAKDKKQLKIGINEDEWVELHYRWRDLCERE